MGAEPGARPPVVLLVEDDPSVARFVAMALDTLPVVVHTCPCVESALAWLQEHRAALVITDLMMPGESGTGLLRRLQATPALAAGARIVVLSAGLDQAVRRELLACGAWRALDKPVPVAALEACVREALGGLLPSTAPTAPPAASIHGAPGESAVDWAIGEFFGGDAALFHAYRAECLAQFVRDAAEGDRAVEGSDLAALHRLCHSLASVLRTLGRADDGALAREIERLALAGSEAAAYTHWALLRHRLRPSPPR
ncbi:response regulator [Paracidovorax konjaci]|uniref:Response regulator receiver domain-containing protein n=1 Tax=Paracidovorax konjaci TaxID=32040 RepID=A0A1I1TFR7_9BURK|nr:response regulator [Paracidovorax konjaci]SFD57461.1 Response regulator receiver domain-containing protein [Paracidovorax konjaci]